MRAMGFIVPLRGAGFRPVSGGPTDRAFASALSDGIVGDFAAGRRQASAISARPRSRREGPLGCLVGAAFASHFHSWRGTSGKRYVCSVFPVLEGKELGGLPEFDGAIALAVACDVRGRRRKIAVLDFSWGDGRFTGDLNGAGDALRAGAREWHVHLLAGDSEARRIAINDIAS